MSIVIRLAEPKDITTIEGLLHRAGVNTTGVAEQIRQFLVVESEQGNITEAVGTVGLEIYEGKYGLMRSLVLKNETWNAQIGIELLRLFLAYAETTGIERLYLLTKSTAPFFIHMDFSTVDRTTIPEFISQSPHFLSYREEDVIAMVKTYKSTHYPQAIVDNVNN